MLRERTAASERSILERASASQVSELSILLQGCQLEVESLKMSLEQLHTKHSQAV